MKDADFLSPWYSDLSTQDPLLEGLDLDFDFFNGDFLRDTDAVDGQQNHVPAAPATPRKKRRSGATAQPRVKRRRIEHSHNCAIHPPPSSKPAAGCFGKWSIVGPYKGARCERAVTTFVDGQLPVCAQHRSQVMQMIRCEAVLECGLPCNEIIPWKPHAYRLCEAHWSRGKCYFLELHVEIRLMIYRYLIPDKPIPASGVGRRHLREDNTPISTAIFRVNKTIHEEVADMFYGQTTFDIHVTNELGKSAAAPPSNISMCYDSNEGDGVSTRDYRIQLRLLEIQRGRFLRTRTTAGGMPTSRPRLRKGTVPGVQYDFTPWQPSLSPRYFRRIRSFRINLSFYPYENLLVLSYGALDPEATPVKNEQNFMCDHIHRFVERLVTNAQIPLRNLEVNVCIQGIPDGDEVGADAQAIAHCQALTGPIRRLRARKARLSLSRTSYIKPDTNIFSLPSSDDESINKSVKACYLELTDLLVLPPPRSPILILFGQLAEVVSQMSQHPFWREADIDKMEHLLNDGRSAREANNMVGLMTTFREVWDMLEKYHSNHQNFIKQMKQSVETMKLKIPNGEDKETEKRKEVTPKKNATLFGPNISLSK